MRSGLLVVGCLLAAGCGGYYNGMYNVKRLAGDARKAERERRTFEAQGLWGQVSVRAESLLARHPRKGWSDEARLLQGTALVRLGDCGRAIPPLEAVMVSGREEASAEAAAVLVGECRLRGGDPVAAAAAYARLARSRDPARRSIAHYRYGQALRLSGQDQAALAELEASRETAAAGERAAALAGLGRLAEAGSLVDTLLLAPDTTTPWDSILGRLQRHDAAFASALVDRVAGSAVPADVRARVLAQDAEYWQFSDSARASRRWVEADSLAQGTQGRRELVVRRARARLAGLQELEALRSQVELLAELSEGLGTARPLIDAGRRVVAAAESVEAGAPGGDLRLFLAGEVARDSLGAPRFAAAQFRRLATEWPASPYAPKALLALVLLDAAAADSLREALRLSYPESPYLHMALGGDAPPGYLVLEDSLRRFVAAYRPAGPRRGPAGEPRPLPGRNPPLPQGDQPRPTPDQTPPRPTRVPEVPL